MTKSTITREQITSWMNDANYALEEPLNADDAAAARAILAMGHELLAAMDSESECLPLDYLQGHKDGLEWAARLAEANHPETGDWLYDDPIELAKAIRKGPDMPPAQPAPVVPDDVLAALQKVARIRLDMNDFDGDRRGIADCLCDAEEALIEVVNRRAAMLAPAPHDTPALNSVQSVVTVPGKWIPVSERLPEDSGRYWCYVEEQNDLGKSHYQWNCSWNGDRWWVESEGGGIVTHWMQLPATPREVK
ncbi:DUF551 domain-containing protein [Klebsiella quasipneumoniae]|uniref:DUF551 domain-containing protein n=1 Tax=Klebsiella quasipneumoniae TaxID=1463165 RepID=UPI002115B3D2|nr:DUF551 domain-containing protein [Klebsiella quasipneumoniae]